MLKHKNVEAPAALTVRASVSNKSGKENIDMNIVAKSDYNFQGFAFNPVTEGGAIWFTSTELAKALGYKKLMPSAKFMHVMLMSFPSRCH